jgi:hypothetical protein
VLRVLASARGPLRRKDVHREVIALLDDDDLPYAAIKGCLAKLTGESTGARSGSAVDGIG